MRREPPNPNQWLGDRARAAGRLAQDQSNLESEAYRAGYVGIEPTPTIAGDTYLMERYELGKQLRARIQRNRGQIIDTTEMDEPQPPELPVSPELPVFDDPNWRDETDEL